MASSFPTSIQTLSGTRGSASSKLNAPSHVDHHIVEDDTVEALQAKVGADSSAVNTSHDYKLSNVATGDKAVSLTGEETVTNKTLGAGTATALGSDATGDTYYRDSNGDLARLAKGNTDDFLVQGATIPGWVANPSTTDASTTERGVVEKATSAEINAGTATGDVGTLTVTPDQLAASDYKKESEINTLIDTKINAAPISLNQFIGLVKADLTTDGLSSYVDLHIVTMANSTNTSAYCQFYMPSAGTLDSLELVIQSGNTTGDFEFDYEISSVVDGAIVNDTSTGHTITDEQPAGVPIFGVIPAAAYNTLTRNAIWALKVTRKGSASGDTAATTTEALGIKVNIS